MRLFTRTDDRTARATLGLFWQVMRTQKPVVIAYSTMIPFGHLLYTVLIPLFISFITQSLVRHPHDSSEPVFFLGCIVGASILSVIVQFFGFRLLFNHEERLKTQLSDVAIKHLLDHSYQFFSTRKVGSLAGDFNGFASSIVSFLDVIFLQASSIIVGLVASLIIICILSPILLIPLGLLTALIIWHSFVAFYKRARFRNVRKKLVSQLNGTVADILGNHMLVRVFAREATEASTIHDTRAEIEDIAHKEIDVLQREALLRNVILYIFLIATLAVSIWLFAQNNLSVAALVFAITYLVRITNSLYSITPILRNLEQLFLDASIMTEVLLTPVEVKDTPKAQPLVVTKGKVELQQLSFNYDDNDNKVFHELSLVIPAGQRVGLAGPSGGGKSTFTKLLLRFTDPQSGKILIDDQDISQVTQASLRAHIAYVPQEPFLFHRTLRENILYGNPEATETEITSAVKRAYADEFIDKLPHGLDTVVGERGVKLSGGQRQRIAIARAILKNAPILILDEATSALDSESEVYIQKALGELMRDRTTIVIAHRLSTIQKMDRIIVMNNGIIEEDGTHKALLENKKLYASLWAHQSGGFIEA